MKCQKNTHTCKIIACTFCAVMVATLLPVAMLASGSGSYRFSTGVVCGKSTTRTISTSAEQYGTHYYYNEHFGEHSRCDYSYKDVTEADVCADRHITNQSTYRNEYDHGCLLDGR